MQLNMQKKRGVHRALYLSLAVFALAVALVVTMIGQASQRVDAEQAARLEEVLRRAAISCYAVEGRFPPNLEHLVEHYGVIIDHSRFVVHYDVVSRTVMPIIQVVWMEGAVG